MPVHHLRLITRHALERILAMSGAERAALVELLWQEILAIPRPPYRSAAEARPRPFVEILEQFPSAPGEPPGVTFQCLSCAYFNVELRHLTAIEADKVRAGGPGVVTSETSTDGTQPSWS